MASIQATKLDLIGRIAAMTDSKQIKIIAELMDNLEYENLPTLSEYEQKLVEEGEADIAAGRVGTMEDLRKAMREGMEAGLKKREERLRKETSDVVKPKRKAA